MRHVTIQKNAHKDFFDVPTVKEWKIVALHLAEQLEPGDIVTLSGPLGAGKTTFVQALAEALGSPKRPQSPTFALMRSYPLKNSTIKRLLHVDAYRIESARELMALDLDTELADKKTILVLEWPENIEIWLGKQKNIWRISVTS